MKDHLETTILDSCINSLWVSHSRKNKTLSTRIGHALPVEWFETKYLTFLHFMRALQGASPQKKQNLKVWSPVFQAIWQQIIGKLCIHFLACKSLQLCLTLCKPMDLEPTRLLCPWEFSRQEYWSGLPCPPPGGFPDPGIELMSLKSPALASRFFTTSSTRETTFPGALQKGL